MLDERGVFAVIEVQPDRNARGLGEREASGRERGERAVEAHGVVADGEQHRKSRPARPPATIPSAYSRVITLNAAMAGRPLSCPACRSRAAVVSMSGRSPPRHGTVVEHGVIALRHP